MLSKNNIFEVLSWFCPGRTFCMLFLFRFQYAKMILMKNTEKTSNQFMKRISIVLLILVAIVCLVYTFALYFTGFGGFLSLVWLFPSALGLLLAGMLAGKIRLKKWQKRLMLYVLIPIIVVFLIVEMIIFSGFLEKPKEEPQYIVVLGTTVYEHGPCYLLRQRLSEAAKWANVYPEATIVVTGGQGATEPFTEGSEMKRYLVEELGISADRILVEETSMNTYENMTFSGAIIEEVDENFSYESTPVLLVTNNFHMYRAMQIAKKAGFEELSGAPSGTYIYLFPHYMVREFFAIIKNLAMGRM